MERHLFSRAIVRVAAGAPGLDEPSANDLFQVVIGQFGFPGRAAALWCSGIPPCDGGNVGVCGSDGDPGNLSQMKMPEPISTAFLALTLPTGESS